MISFSCPGCGKTLDATDAEAGHKISCPRCERRVWVPAEGGQAARPVPKGVVPIRDCPDCGAALEVPEDQLGGRVVCPDCGGAFLARRRKKGRSDEDEDDGPRTGRRGKKYCPECGAALRARDRYCSECDAPQEPEPAVRDAGSKKLAAGICAILVGGLGVHKFILGYTTAGVTMLLVSLLTCFVGSPVMHVIGLVEGIIYLTKSDEDFRRIYIVGKKEWF
jgi:TM2 domain-containing membrane protein YozV/DNA-directed RNA polymerase subunit RPC12/RpoP